MCIHLVDEWRRQANLLTLTFNPLSFETVRLFSIDVTFNSTTFVNDVAFNILEPRHLAQLGVKGLNQHGNIQCNSIEFDLTL